MVIKFFDRGHQSLQIIDPHARLSTVEEEADETLFWLEVINELEIFQYQKLDLLMKENNEIISIVVASINTAKMNKA